MKKTVIILFGAMLLFVSVVLLPLHALSYYSGDSLWPILSDQFSILVNPNQPDVQRQIRYYSHHPRFIALLSKNAQPYLYTILQETKRHHMPAEIALLPMIESNYEPFTCSKAGAVGLWQIMPGTASGYGIPMNWWYDGRRDTQAATHVALTYLSYLHQVFNGNWLLAIAAYDAGAGTVMNAIHYNQKHHRPTNFWALPLPHETKIYVPKLLAIAWIIQHPHRYGLQLAPIPNVPITKTTTIYHQMNLSSIAHMTNSSETLIRHLNPGFRRFATPPHQSATITIPVKAAGTFAQNLMTRKEVKTKWTHYTVRSGDTLGAIAKQFHIAITTLKRANNLHNNTIRVHQALLIPNKSERNLPHSATTHVEQKPMIPKKHGHANQPHFYIVRAGDSLNIIAAHHHTTAHQLMVLNALKTSILHIGQRLRI